MRDFPPEIPEVYRNFKFSRWSVETALLRIKEADERLQHIARPFEGLSCSGKAAGVKPWAKP